VTQAGRALTVHPRKRESAILGSGFHKSRFEWLAWGWQPLN
jgi:hypothetical protein